MQVVDDETLPFIGVLAHVELQQIVDRIVLRDAHLVQPHTVADELAELVGRNLAETFEPRDFGIRAAPGDRLEALLLRIAVVRLLPVAHAEQRGLQHV